MRDLKERRIEKFSLENREELVEQIVLYQTNLIKIEFKLGNVEKEVDENYLNSFKERLSKLSISSLRKYYFMLVELYLKKYGEYKEKVKKEQEELLGKLIEEYLGEDAPSVPNLPEIIDIQPVQPILPQQPVQPVFPQYPWDKPDFPNVPWWHPDYPLRITCENNSILVRSL